jgi:VIT1/CCC1 family predicted Fe2+/Mn2+ transporter
MFKNGPIPPWVHGGVDYLLGAFLILSPFLFSYDSGAATATGIIAGVLVLVLASSTAWATGLIKSIPPSAHAIFDLIIAVLLIASPFLFGFSDETNPTAVFMVTGVLALLYAIGTRYSPEPKPARESRTTPASDQLDRSASDSSNRTDGSSSASPNSERSRRSR